MLYDGLVHVSLSLSVYISTYTSVLITCTMMYYICYSVVCGSMRTTAHTHTVLSHSVTTRSRLLLSHYRLYCLSHCHWHPALRLSASMVLYLPRSSTEMQGFSLLVFILVSYIYIQHNIYSLYITRLYLGRSTAMKECRYYILVLCTRTMYYVLCTYVLVHVLVPCTSYIYST